MLQLMEDPDCCLCLLDCCRVMHAHIMDRRDGQACSRCNPRHDAVCCPQGMPATSAAQQAVHLSDLGARSCGALLMGDVAPISAGCQRSNTHGAGRPVVLWYNSGSQRTRQSFQDMSATSCQAATGVSRHRANDHCCQKRSQFDW